MRVKDVHILLNRLIKKFNSSVGDSVEVYMVESIEEKMAYLETSIVYILFDNDCLKKELKKEC